MVGSENLKQVLVRIYVEFKVLNNFANKRM